MVTEGFVEWCRRVAAENYTTVDSQQKGNGTMSEFKAMCALVPEDGIGVRGNTGQDAGIVRVIIWWASGGHSVYLSAPDATRLCAHLIEQGFGPKAAETTPIARENLAPPLRDVHGRVDELEDTVKDAHERIDHSIEAIGENTSDIRRIDNRIADILSMFNGLERRLNSAASELKG